MQQLLDRIVHLEGENARLLQELKEFQNGKYHQEAQQRIAELEQEVRKLKKENKLLKERERLIKNKVERLAVKLQRLEL
ncbi:MAG: hypothetical protein D6681_12050 [Calditrichaeota bacterium]|nr:MAG: hypothetical protein D6681_12050 [Calditrichota bacterium]